MLSQKFTLCARAATVVAGAASMLISFAGPSGADTAPTPGPAGAPVSSVMQPLLKYKQCVKSGPDAHDKHVAHELAGKIKSPRLDSPSPYQISCARAIIAEVKKERLIKRAGVIAVTTAITESSLHDYTQVSDGTSLGLYQQQTSEGWGSPSQVEDPAHSTHSFLHVMQQFYKNGKWKHGDIGRICQAVQRSAVPGAYDPEVSAATKIVNRLW